MTTLYVGRMKKLLLAFLFIISPPSGSSAQSEEYPASIELEYIAFLQGHHIWIQLRKEGDKVRFYSCRFEFTSKTHIDPIKELKRIDEVKKEIPLSHFENIRDYLTKPSTARLFKKGNGAGADGTGWSFSFIEGGYRQKFSVWTPSINEEDLFDEMIALGSELFDITGYDIPKSEIY